MLSHSPMFILPTLFSPLLPWICYSYGNCRPLWMASGPHCRGLSEPFFTHSLQAHRKITPVEHTSSDSVLTSFTLCPSYSLCMSVLRCTWSHTVLINCKVLGVLHKSKRAAELHWRHSQRCDTGRRGCDEICSMRIVVIRVSTPSSLIFCSNRNPSFFFKDAWDILSHRE